MVSKDEDFYQSALKSGKTVPVVWIRMGNCRKQALIEAVGRILAAIVESLNAGESIIEVR